jgi:hypothetical protein
MRWDTANQSNSLLQTYKALAKLRRSSSFPAESAPTPLFTDDANGTLGYARIGKSSTVVVLLNRSDNERQIDFTPPAGLRLALSRHYQNVLTHQPVARQADGRISLTLAPKAAAVLLATEGSSSSTTLNHPRG